MQRAVAFRVTPAQIGIEHVPGQVVAAQPARRLVDEGLGAEPLEQFGRIGRGWSAVRLRLVQHGPQHRLGDMAGVAADLQRGQVPRARRGVDQPVEQGPDQIGILGQTGRQRGRRPGTPDRVDHQGQGQRVAVGQPDHLLVHRGRDLLDLQIAPGAFRRQAAQ